MKVILHPAGAAQKRVKQKAEKKPKATEQTAYAR
jgi:hypothetical protein